MLAVHARCTLADSQAHQTIVLVAQWLARSAVMVSIDHRKVRGSSPRFDVIFLLQYLIFCYFRNIHLKSSRLLFMH